MEILLTRKITAKIIWKSREKLHYDRIYHG